jgi:hypothetical protein
MDNTKNKPENLTHEETDYPVASMAFYGPDDRFASKVVVGILMSEQDKEATYLHRWFANKLDVRMDTTIIKEIMEYIKLYQARRVVMVDRIIGCPHEEGIDYPMGEVCPQCPFWAHRDRWTGEIIDPA